MGFFKKIGSAIKTGAKQISFKNAVKIVGGLDPSGIVTGIQTSHELEKQGRREEAEYQAQLQAQKVGQVAGGIAQKSTEAFFNQAYEGVNQGFKNSIGNTGSQVIDLSIKQWFKDNWKLLLIGVGIIALVIFLIKRNGQGKRRRPTNSRR